MRRRYLRQLRALELVWDKGGSIVCKDLKATVDGKQRYDCADCIKDAARIVEELLFGEENE